MLPAYSELGHQSFPAFGLKLTYYLLLGLKPAGFWTGTYTISPLGPQTFTVHTYLLLALFF